VEVLAVTLPVPRHPGLETLQRHRLDLDEHACDILAVLGLAGRETEPTVGHEHTGEPVPATRRGPGVPEKLGVVVGMDVDESGGAYQPGGVDHFLGRTIYFAQRGDLTAGHTEVAAVTGQPRAVDEKTVLNQQIILHHRSSFTSSVPTVPSSLAPDKDSLSRGD